MIGRQKPRFLLRGTLNVPLYRAPLLFVCIPRVLFNVCANIFNCLRRQKKVPARGRPGLRPARSGRSDQRKCVKTLVKHCKMGFWTRRGRSAPGLPMAHAPCAMVWPGPFLSAQTKNGSPGINLIIRPGGRHPDSGLRDS